MRARSARPIPGPTPTSLFGVIRLDAGLGGYDARGKEPPKVMSLSPTGCAGEQVSSLGIPLVPYRRFGLTKTYPLMRVMARDAANNLLAKQALFCGLRRNESRACHASGTRRPPRSRRRLGFMSRARNAISA